MATKLVCWHCGTPLKGVPLPISRLAECPRCRADLHVCRMCKFYDTRLIGECSHDRAERILDKNHANFCTYFRPRPGAYDPQASAQTEAARARLEAFFGMKAEGAESEDEGESESESGQDPGAKSEAERAREELEKLFGLGKKNGE